jgi:hypothetical protein
LPKKDITAGETLCTFIKKNILDGRQWSELTQSLSATGRGEQWAGFVEEVVSTQLTGRLVTAGKSIADNLGGKEILDTLQFEQQLNAMTRETTLISIGKREQHKFLDLIKKAVRATYGKVTEADKQTLREEIGVRPNCYLCNLPLELRVDSYENPTDDQLKRAVEYEHVWPRAFGGDTTIDNLALSCNDCNQRKDCYANWSMVDIQSLVLGFNPSDQSLTKIAGWRRFAMLSYAAHKLADEESLSLKDAHLRLQYKITVPRVRRPGDVADFFNLIAHMENY